MPAKERISVVVPVHHEAESIADCLRGLAAALADHPHEILIVHDDDDDPTLAAVEAMTDRPAAARLVKNDLGPGVAHALRAGFAAATGDVVVTTMADLSDPPAAIPRMAEKIRREGADVVSGSRYMRGGSQTGGPRLKGLLSRLAGLSLRWVAGVGTHDATTNFRAYRASFLRGVDLESRHGFEVALELTVKAHLAGRKVDEVPSTWKERDAGESRFRLWAWLPRYLGWYARAMLEPVVVWAALVALLTYLYRMTHHHVLQVPYWDEWHLVGATTGHHEITLDWLWAQHNEHRILLPKLIYILVGRATDMNARVMGALLVSVLGLMAIISVGLARRLRGRTVLADAFLPLLLLHWGQCENLTWTFQISFILPTGLLFGALAGVLVHRDDRPGRTAWIVGPCLAALPLSSGIGLPMVMLLAPWLLAVGVRALRVGGRRAWPAAATAIAFCGCALALLVLYVWQYSQPPFHAASPSIGASLAEAARALSVGYGHATVELWPWSGALAVAVAVAAALATGLAALRPGAGRPRAMGLLLGLGGLVGLGLAIGHGRAGLPDDSGFAFRYTAFMCLIPWLAYMISLSYVPPGARRAVQTLLAVLMLVLLWPNTQHGMEKMKWHRVYQREILGEIRQGEPIVQLARRHALKWLPDPDGFAYLLGLLAQERMSVYRVHPPPDLIGETPELDGATMLEAASPECGTWVPIGGGKKAYLAHAPTSFAVTPPPGAVRVRFVFGIGDWRTDGVLFRLHVEDPGGARREIWSRLLDPAGESDDRWLHIHEVELPSLPSYRLIFETDPGPEGDTRWDWSFWTGLSFPDPTDTD